MQLSGLPKCAERYTDNFQRLYCLNAIQKQLLNTAATNKRGEDKHLYSRCLACHWRPPTIQAISDSVIKTHNSQQTTQEGQESLKHDGGHRHLLQPKWTLTLWNWHGCCQAVSNNNIFYSNSTTITRALGDVQINKCNSAHINMLLKLA